MAFNRFFAIGALTLVLAPNPAAAQEPTTTTNLFVKVSQPWTDTGVDILSLDTPIRITGEGTVDVGLVSRRVFSPTGDDDCTGSFGTPLLASGLPCWSLVGRIGGGAPFLIGKSLVFEPKDLGRLFVGVNDELFYFTDNSGDWSVTITTRHARDGGAPSPASVLAAPEVAAALKRAFQGVPGSTVLARLDVREEWEIRAPAFDRTLSPGVVEIAAGLPGPEDRTWDDTDAAVRQGLEAVDTLAAADYGWNAKAFLIRLMVESLVEATPLIPTAEVAKLSSALERAAREGLTDDVRDLLIAGKRPRYIVAASAKAAATVKLGAPDDLVVLRFRSTEGKEHVYDVFATWSEKTAPGVKHTDYGDVRIENGRQGYARHQLAVLVNPKGALAVKPGPMKPLYTTAADTLWLRGELAALK